MDFLSVAGEYTAERTIEKSRFLSYVAHTAGEEEARAFLDRVRREHPLSTHVCWAYIGDRLGNLQRFSDDGEPQGTAGMPILDVLRHENLVDVCCVVTRYFGGILLGSGGLVRAYTTAASRALDAAEKVTVQPVVKLSTMVEYPLYERVDLLVAAAGGRMEAPVFTDKVALTWQMRAGTEAPLLEQLRELTRGRGRVEVSEPFYGAV